MTDDCIRVPVEDADGNVHIILLSPEDAPILTELGAMHIRKNRETFINIPSSQQDRYTTSGKTNSQGLSRTIMERVLGKKLPDNTRIKKLNGSSDLRRSSLKLIKMTSTYRYVSFNVKMSGFQVTVELAEGGGLFKFHIGVFDDETDAAIAANLAVRALALKDKRSRILKDRRLNDIPGITATADDYDAILQARSVGWTPPEELLYTENCDRRDVEQKRIDFRIELEAAAREVFGVTSWRMRDDTTATGNGGRKKAPRKPKYKACKNFRYVADCGGDKVQLVLPVNGTRQPVSPVWDKVTPQLAAIAHDLLMLALDNGTDDLHMPTQRAYLQAYADKCGDVNAEMLAQNADNLCNRALEQAQEALKNFGQDRQAA